MRQVKLVQNADGVNALELDNPVHSEILIDYSEWEKHAGKPDNAIVDGVFVPGKDIEKPAPDYRELRRAAYPPITEQLDMRYHDEMNKTTVWLDTITAIKEKYPKPEVDNNAS